MALLDPWRRLPKGVRNTVSFVFKAAITVGGCWLLLAHPIEGDNHVKQPVYAAIAEYIGTVDLRMFLFWSAVAMAIKFVGVISSAYAWALLLRGQRLKFPFWSQIMTAFLIGRFLGTFMPSTIGLDGYTLWEAGRFTNQWHRAITAKALEKFIGLAGLFTGLLLTLPVGYYVLEHVVGQHALLVTALIGVICGGVTGTVVLGLVKPLWLKALMTMVGGVVPGPVRKHVDRFTEAVVAYDGQAGLLLLALLSKFVTHFTTAVVYYFTALAIGVVGVEFLPIVFGSLIQIFATLFSPTIAGEGAREAVQALMLEHYLKGTAQAVLSAGLGFWAAEAATLWGGLFLWWRPGGKGALAGAGWRPAYCLVDDQQVDYAWIPTDDAGFDAEKVAAQTRG